MQKLYAIGCIAAAVALAPVASNTAGAAEGVWLLNHLPVDAIAKDLGSPFDTTWITRAQRATLRTPGWCTSSLVSPNGLVMTNHHCLVSCLSQDRGGISYLASGYLAQRQEQELTCNNVELDQLIEITDLTEAYKTAMVNVNDDDYGDKKEQWSNAKADACSSRAQNIRCEIIGNSDIASIALYKYRIHRDIRLVFAPEASVEVYRNAADRSIIAYDVAFLRIYEGGKPIESGDSFLPISNGTISDNTHAFVIGNPLETYRNRNFQELDVLRQRTVMSLFGHYELRGVIEGFKSSAQRNVDGYDALKYLLDVSIVDEHELFDPFSDLVFLFRRNLADQKLNDDVKKEGHYVEELSSVQKSMSSALDDANSIYEAYYFFERSGKGFEADLAKIARDIVRLAANANKPDDQRLSGYHDKDIADVMGRVLSDKKIDKAFEEAKLSYSIQQIYNSKSLTGGAKEALFHSATAAQVAHMLISGTKLDNLEERRKLVDGGATAVAQSTDPLIVFFRDHVEAISIGVRNKYDKALAVVFKDKWRIAEIKQAIQPAERYPDATGTLRLSFGKVEGLSAGGAQLPAIARINSIFDSASSTGEKFMTESWQNSRQSLAGDTPISFLGSIDTLGGNSGSPVLNVEGKVIGVLSGGISVNTFYSYDDRYRAICVAVPGIIEVLTHVYHADVLVKELRGT